MPPTVQLATTLDREALAPLFDSYRQFYEQAPDLEAARRFIEDRLNKSDSDILIARNGEGEAIGFIQLYPTFCSIAAKPIAILNDLYVHSSHRKTGVASLLMDEAQRLGQKRGWAYLLLSTAHTNTRAQALYEQKGWALDTVYRYYTLTL